MPKHILKLDNILSIWMVVLASCLLSGETSRISAPEVKAVRPSEETLLKCRVTGSTLLDNNVTWSMNGTLLTAGNTTVNSLEGRVHVVNHLNVWHLLVTPDVSLDQSEWMCKAGSTLLSWLIITVPVCVPKIILTESSWSQMYTTEHADVRLRCVATGNPEPQITWYRRSRADYNIVTDIPVTGELLVINNIERHASDIYVCKASSDQGSVTHSIELTVHFSAGAEAMETKIASSPDKAVLMGCAVHGSNITGVYWMSNHNRKIDKSEGRYLVSTEDLPGYPVLFTTLVLKAGTWGHLDIGTYRCYVTQDSDEAWAEVTLIKNVT